MRVAIDLDDLSVRTWAGQAISAMQRKRRDKVLVEVRFTRGGVAQELANGATGVCGVKKLKAFTAGFLASALSWTKSGSGVTTVYSFELNLNTTQFNTEFASNPEKVAAALEVEWVVGDYRYSSLAMPLNVFNDYIRGDEGVPVDGDPVYPLPDNILTKSGNLAGLASASAARVNLGIFAGALVNKVSVPANSAVAGAPGDFAVSAQYLYLYTGDGATHAWLRISGANDF
jgi:hypothetical protein